MNTSWMRKWINHKKKKKYQIVKSDLFGGYCERVELLKAEAGLCVGGAEGGPGDDR